MFSWALGSPLLEAECGALLVCLLILLLAVAVCLYLRPSGVDRKDPQDSVMRKNVQSSLGEAVPVSDSAGVGRGGGCGQGEGGSARRWWRRRQ